MRAFLSGVMARPLGFGVLTWAVLLGACIASAPTGLERETNPPDAGQGTGGFTVSDAGPGGNEPAFDAGDDPHAVIGTQPSHGPFTGGQRVLVSGRGFSSKARVWFGATEAPSSSVLAVDAAHVQVSAPPGHAGPVDVAVQDGSDASTKRTLQDGYTYDALYASPSTGPTSGGTQITITGDGTHFDAKTKVFIDMLPCTKVAVASATKLTCITPKDTTGGKPISVTTGSETQFVLDAFTYSDSDNGYKGGLDGDPLAGNLEVLVYDNYTGAPIEAAHAIVGADITTAIIGQTDANGIAELSDPSLVAPIELTITGPCHSPQTLVGVGVDSATIFLDPILTPECAGTGDPPPVGGHSEPSGTVTGELVWPTINEFQKGDWQTVPRPISKDERKAAFVMMAASSPTSAYYQPSDDGAVTPESKGTVGYDFSLDVDIGTYAFYALAGIENTTTGTFVPYVMGVVRGVPVSPGGTTDKVYISMDTTLDQRVTLDVAGPTPGPRGPDRLQVSVAVMLESDGFLVFPATSASPLLPYSGSLPFIGLPPLEGPLAGSSYITTATGVTGPSGGLPQSVIAQLITTSASTPVGVKGFVGVPTLTTPAAGASWDQQHLAVTYASGAPVDITVYDAVAGNGVAHWLVAVPGGANAVQLPDISSFPMAALPNGPLTITVTGGTVQGFDYTKLRYRYLSSSGMTAYGTDNFSSHD